MNEQSRIFDFVYYQLSKYAKPDMFVEKINGSWEPLSTRQVIDTVNRLSAGLLKLGIGGQEKEVEAQDKVALISRNRPEWLMLDLACQQVGAILCPIYPTTNPNELAYIFNDAEIKIVFLSGDEILEKVQDVKSKVPSLQSIISFDAGAVDVRYWKSLTENITETELQRVEEIKNNIKATSCATIIYTSGTTGFPKGVMLSHRNIVMNVLHGIKSFPFDENVKGRTLSFLPLNHIFERIATYIFISSCHSIYFAESMEAIGENLKEVKPSIFCTVPRLLEKVYEKIEAKGKELTGVKRKLFDWSVEIANKYDNRKSGGFIYNIKLAIANKLVFSKWREALGGNIQGIITGGAACQVRLIRVFTAAKIPIYEGYGPTENSPVISVNGRKNTTKFGTVGPVIVGQEVKIMPDGEICVKGPSVMMGYYKQPQLTAETIIDGWLHTGDIGVFEDKIFLKITDRKKELFKTSGGKYVAPQPIENKMKESPFVEQIMIIGAEEKFVGALIVPSMPNLKEWMRTQDIPFTTNEDAVHNPKVRDLYRELIESFNKFFNQVEQVKKFELLANEWTINTGELTPTLKLKRKVIMEKNKSSIERIYN